VRRSSFTWNGTGTLGDVNADSSGMPFRLAADDPLQGLNTWVAEGLVDAAANERARQRWLERQATEDATLLGVLIDLAERGRPVAVRSGGGRTARGRVFALGADFVAVREERLGDVLIPTRAIATVRAAPGDAPTVGDRAASLVVVLAEALLELAADRPTVLLSAANEEQRGELRSVGRDVLALMIEGERRETIHVAIDAIDHLVILGR
jgi:hypothetical protein